MKAWRSTWGTWRQSSADDRYERDVDGVWRYGAGRLDRAGLPVVAAIDFLLAELVSPVVGETQRRPPVGPWDDGLPYGMRPQGLYLSLNEVGRRPELRELDHGPSIHDWRSRADWVYLDAGRWERLRTRVIGLRAPELAASGYARLLAAAERDVRVARRQRAQASERRQLIAWALGKRGTTRGQLGRVLGVSRERAHQLIAACANAETDDRARLSSDDISLGALRVADEVWRRSCAHLAEAQSVRRQRVLKASDGHFEMGLGEIADILGVSRSQAQQLRDSAAALVEGPVLGSVPPAPR